MTSVRQARRRVLAWHRYVRRYWNRRDASGAWISSGVWISWGMQRGYEQAITHLREQAERRRNHPNTQPWDLADARELTYAADYLAARLTEETTG